MFIVFFHLFIIQLTSQITGFCGKNCQFTFDEQNNELIYEIIFPI